MLNSPSHDVACHTMLQKSGAKVQLLFELSKQYNYNIRTISGGEKDNSIAPRSEAVIVVEDGDTAGVVEMLNKYAQLIINEYSVTDKDMSIKVSQGSKVSVQAMDYSSTNKVVLALTHIQDGVVKLSNDIKGLVQTSINAGVVRMEDGTTILVDSGSTDNSRLYEYTLEPFLLSRGVDELDYVIVTHCDNDHISALKALLNESVIHVTNFCMPSTTCIDDAYEDLWELASESASNIMEIYAGMRIQTADGTVTCIHPSYQYKCDDRNDYSTTLVVQYGEFTALLTGDISSEQEKEILPYVQPYAPFDLLKAAHHGSKYSSCTEFLDEVSPLACIISCGIDNSYGHPHTETMDRINAAGSEIYRTDEIGAVLVNLRDGKVNINGYR